MEFKEIESLWKECFDDTPQWREYYFKNIFNQNESFNIRKDGKLISSLSMVPYLFNCYGRLLPSKYLMGAMTHRDERNRGHMTGLIRRAMETACDNGDTIVALIPASRDLFFYYAKLGFESVFFLHEERYLSGHSFGKNDYYEIKADDNMLWNYFNRKEKEWNYRLLHSKSQFDNVKWDILSDSGIIKTVGENGQIKGIVFAVPHLSENEVTVKEIFFDDTLAYEALLNLVMKYFPGMNLTVEKKADNNQDKNIEARGMLRILNIMPLFEVLVSEFPSINTVIKIHDRFLPVNDNIFILRDGKVLTSSDYTGHIDSELDIKDMAGVLFNTSATGEWFGLKSQRPSLSLMLD